MITIIDYGMGNLGSMLNMLKKIDVPAKISSDINEIKKAQKLILPGVGAFDQAMQNLEKRNFIPLLNQIVIEQKTPILGVCLGMQLFSQKSEEGNLPGLSWLDAKTIKFAFNGNRSNLKIPHMGWNTITIKKTNPLLTDLGDEPRFYFVHSYHVYCNNQNEILATCNYGLEFTACLQKNNIYAAQFHPEKSHKFGMKLLTNFSKL